jgi:NAD(P)-dependent dehydrogenase (short-subunit alcohol dehydrogenase family)
MMKRIFITGANRGLGLEFVRQFLENGDKVIAACREPNQAAVLQQFKNSHPDQLTILKLDVTNQDEIEAAAVNVESAVNGLDLLINNAGISSGSAHLGQMNFASTRTTFEINAFAPVMILQRFVDLLSRGENSRVVNITSGLGSIAETSGSHLSYSASKAALNMFTRAVSFALRQKGIIAIVMDPGWVQTDMGGAEAPLNPAESISGMCKVINGLRMEDTGRYLRYDGVELPW